MLYNDYLRVMTCMHERLRAVYNTYVCKYLDDRTRKDAGLEAETARLILPGEEGTDGECDFPLMFADPKKSNKEEEQKASNNQDYSTTTGVPPIGDVEETKGNAEEDAFESFSERKTHTNVPQLKNNKIF